MCGRRFCSKSMVGRGELHAALADKLVRGPGARDARYAARARACGCGSWRYACEYARQCDGRREAKPVNAQRVVRRWTRHARGGVDEGACAGSARPRRGMHVAESDASSRRCSGIGVDRAHTTVTNAMLGTLCDARFWLLGLVEGEEAVEEEGAVEGDGRRARSPRRLGPPAGASRCTAGRARRWMVSGRKRTAHSARRAAKKAVDVACKHEQRQHHGGHHARAACARAQLGRRSTRRH